MTLPGFLILITVASIAALIFLELASLPGKKAREREHPQADAINVLGWLGLLLGGVAWVVALVWAYTRPGVLASPDTKATGSWPSQTAASGEEAD